MTTNDAKDPNEKNDGVFVPADEARHFDENLTHLRELVTKSIGDQQKSLEELRLALEETYELFETRFIGFHPRRRRRKRSSRKK